MNLSEYFWFFQSVIPERICNDIVSYGKSLESGMAITGGYDTGKKLDEKEIKDLKKSRHSDVVWLNDQWIYKEIQPYVNKANVNAGCKFDWDWSESCQFTKYGVGQYYGWHCDAWDKPYDKPDWPNQHGKVRKLSVTVSLSDPDEYEGGELEFDFRNENPDDEKRNIVKCEQILPKGSLVVFPSFVWHRVAPVTKGTRYSLVIWNVGWPFK